MVLRIQSQHLLILHFLGIMINLLDLLTQYNLSYAIEKGKHDEELNQYVDLDIFVRPYYYIFWLHFYRLLSKGHAFIAFLLHAMDEVKLVAAVEIKKNRN